MVDPDEDWRSISHRCPKCGQYTDSVAFDLKGVQSSFCQKCIDDGIVFCADNEDTYVEKIVSRITDVPARHRLYPFIIKLDDTILRNSNVAVGEVLETSVGRVLYRKQMITVETPVTVKNLVIISAGKSVEVEGGTKHPTPINMRVASMIERIDTEVTP